MLLDFFFVYSYNHCDLSHFTMILAAFNVIFITLVLLSLL